MQEVLQRIAAAALARNRGPSNKVLFWQRCALQLLGKLQCLAGKSIYASVSARLSDAEYSQAIGTDFAEYLFEESRNGGRP